MLKSIHINNFTETISTHINSNLLTRYYRIFHVSVHTIIGVVIVSLIFPIVNQSIRSKLIKWWCKHLLVIFNFSVYLHGHLPLENKEKTGMLFVANHISWTDIHAINSIVPLRFIAKSEIKSWPIFGYLAKKTNVLFINREKRQETSRIVQITSSNLINGDNLCLFPEGTTTDGTRLMPFKSSIFQAAIHAKAIIQPIAIRYPSVDGGPNKEIAYAGETTLCESIKQILLQQNPVVELHFLTPFSTVELSENDKSRRKLAQYIEQSIKEKLSL